mmetsp:Transcript_52961/g.163870  ORF Transcript_52961/g.163870 Transcript_52961/m.163870 type:complete len:271 (-) Transcript_52961:12-824(-)
MAPGSRGRSASWSNSPSDSESGSSSSAPSEMVSPSRDVSVSHHSSSSLSCNSSIVSRYCATLSVRSSNFSRIKALCSALERKAPAIWASASFVSHLKVTTRMLASCCLACSSSAASSDRACSTPAAVALATTSSALARAAASSSSSNSVSLYIFASVCTCSSANSTVPGRWKSSYCRSAMTSRKRAISSSSVRAAGMASSRSAAQASSASCREAHLVRCQNLCRVADRLSRRRFAGVCAGGEDVRAVGVEGAAVAMAQGGQARSGPPLWT